MGVEVPDGPVRNREMNRVACVRHHVRDGTGSVRFPRMRLAPKSLTGILVFLGYFVVFYGVWIINGIEYSRISESSDTILKWIVAPLAAGALYLIIVVSALG